MIPLSYRIQHLQTAKANPSAQISTMALGQPVDMYKKFEEYVDGKTAVNGNDFNLKNRDSFRQLEMLERKVQPFLLRFFKLGRMRKHKRRQGQVLHAELTETFSKSSVFTHDNLFC